MILQKEFHVIYALAHVCGQDRTLLASLLLKIFRHEKAEAPLLRTLNDREINMEGKQRRTSESQHRRAAPSARGSTLTRFSRGTATRRGDDVVQSDHARQHADGAVHESHGDAVRPPRSQRHHPQDHGEQTVLRGTGRVQEGSWVLLWFCLQSTQVPGDLIHLLKERFFCFPQAEPF